MTDKPKLPIGYMLREGDLDRKCPACNSSQKWPWWKFWCGWPHVGTLGCIHSGCDRYWKAVTDD